MKRNVYVSVLTILVLLFILTPAAFAASLADIPDTTLRVGNDFYSMTSANFDDEHLMASLANDTCVYFKFGGKWYNVLTLGDAQIGDSAYAESDAAVAQWAGLGTWYKDGTGTEQVTTGLTGTYTITEYNSMSDELNVNVSGLDEVQYFNIYKDGVALSNSCVPMDQGLVSLKQMFSDLSALQIRFYSDAAGNNLVATATLANGILNITTTDEPDEFKVIDIY